MYYGRGARGIASVNTGVIGSTLMLCEGRHRCWKCVAVCIYCLFLWFDSCLYLALTLKLASALGGDGDIGGRAERGHVNINGMNTILYLS